MPDPLAEWFTPPPPEAPASQRLRWVRRTMVWLLLIAVPTLAVAVATTDLPAWLPVLSIGLLIFGLVR